MGRLVVNNSMTVNGAFEAPAPEPDGWLVRISAPENGESGRATGSRIGSLDLPPPTQDRGLPGGRGVGS